MTMPKFLQTFHRGRASTMALALVATWMTGGLVACSDSPAANLSAPPSPSSSSVAVTPAPAAYFGLHGASVVSRKVVGDTTVTQFIVTPRAPISIFDIGNQSKILFPLGATSICDPASSGYGIGLWDTPCQPLTRSITITAKSWVNPTNGGVNTDFSPELRFVPGQVMGVTLFLHDDTPKTFDRIDYCTGGVCVDDSQVDGALVTNRDGSGFVYRVIKHFSGYNVVVN